MDIVNPNEDSRQIVNPNEDLRHRAINAERLRPGQDAWPSSKRGAFTTRPPSFLLRMSLRTWASVNGVWSWSWHYRVIIGIQQVHKEWTEPFLWWTVLQISDSYYYYMHDNGSDGIPMSGGCNWWEVAGSFAQFESVTAKNK
ncbi:MAG: hypothetical protein JXR70_19145 [Spirochaetales bacterium]|nr:hypothetical protein [Spirochaetales bacterium]